MKIKSLGLLASLGVLFLLPVTVQGTETRQEVKDQEAVLAVLEKQVEKVNLAQADIQIELNTFMLDKSNIEQKLEKIMREKALVEAEIKSEETRLRVMDTIQGYLIGEGPSGMEVIRVKDAEKRIEALKKSVTSLDEQIAEKEQEVTQRQAKQTAELAEKENLVEESKALDMALIEEKQVLDALIKKQAAEAEEAKRLEKTGFLTPLAIPLNISSPFGNRADPTGYSGNGHDGIDFTGSAGDAILAARYGTVVEAGSDWSAGNYVIIQHDNGYYSYYMHMTQVFVTKGQSLGTLEQIGTMGTTGNSTGVHLHFGLATGIWSGFVNPASFIL